MGKNNGEINVWLGVLCIIGLAGVLSLLFFWSLSGEGKTVEELNQEGREICEDMNLSFYGMQTNWDDLSQVYCNIEDFEGLAKEACNSWGMDYKLHKTFWSEYGEINGKEVYFLDVELLECTKSNITDVTYPIDCKIMENCSWTGEESSNDVECYIELFRKFNHTKRFDLDGMNDTFSRWNETYCECGGGNGICGNLGLDIDKFFECEDIFCHTTNITISKETEGVVCKYEITEFTHNITFGGGGK